jgi:hypothetical protein
MVSEASYKWPQPLLLDVDVRIYSSEPASASQTLGCCKATLKLLQADAIPFTFPEDLTDETTAQIGLYTHLCQDGRTSGIGLMLIPQAHQAEGTEMGRD